MLRGKISEHFSSIGSAVLEELRNKQTDRQKETYHCFSEKDNKIFYFKELIKLFRVQLLFDDKLTWQRPAEHLTPKRLRGPRVPATTPLETETPAEIEYLYHSIQAPVCQ